MKSYFFDDALSAIAYIILIVALPVMALIAQLCFNDRTMYLSYLIAGVSLTYDHIIIVKNKKICKRLWIEFITSLSCLFAVAIIASWKIVTLLFRGENTQVVPYGIRDVFFVLILGIVIVIDIIEFCGLIRFDYKQRFPNGNDNGLNLIEGAKNI